MGPALLDEIPKELIERYKGSWMGCNSVSRKTLRLNGWGAEDYAQVLRGVAARGDVSLALYVHLLFCPVRCLYCGCNTNVTPDGGRIDEYLDLLECEMDLVVDHLGQGRRVVQFHVGGGTPNYLSDSQLARLMQMIDARFQRREGAACIGYTAVPADHLVALGTNGIGDVDGVMAQNEPRIDAWRRAILAGRLPIAWGRRLSDEDRRRRKAFEHLMCNLELPASMVEGLEEEYQSLCQCADDRLVEVTEDAVRVTARGRYFLRDLGAKHAAGLDWDSAQWRGSEMR